MSLKPWVDLNGSLTPLAEAKVSVLDRGFMFADGIYEVISVYNRRIFALEEHIERLQASLLALKIKVIKTQKDWRELIERLLRQHPDAAYDHCSVYIQVTRGAAESRQHRQLDQLTPTVLVMLQPIPRPTVEQYLQACTAITCPDIRAGHAYLKTISLLANVMSYQQAVSCGHRESILTRQHQVTEGSQSNVFIVKSGQIITPALSKYVVNGVTRIWVIAAAQALSIPCSETTVSVADLYAADEVFITGSTKGIVPLNRIDDRVIGEGEVGDVTRRIVAHFVEHINQFSAS